MVKRWNELLENKLVKKWYENNNAGSNLTAGYYLRNLGMFLEFLNKVDYVENKEKWQSVMKEAPNKLINLAKEDFNFYADAYTEFVRKLEKEGKSGSGIAVTIYAVVSFLDFNRVPGRVKIKIGNKGIRPVKDNETVPTNDQLATVLRQARTKTGLMISLMAFSGVRPEVIGNYNGTDGLRISDLLDLKINDSIEVTKIPLKIRVRTTLSKNDREYYTFLSQEGCIYLKEYLEQRLKEGKLKGEDPLILPSQSNGHSFLETAFVSRYIKDAIMKSGFSWRPYVLRRYFVTQLALAESKGMITHSWRQFISGHKGDMQSVYEDMTAHIDEVRQAYERATKYLGTINYEVSKDEVNREVVKGMLRYFVEVPEDEIDKIVALEPDEVGTKIWDAFEKIYQKRVMETYKAITNGEDAGEIEKLEFKRMHDQIDADINRLKGRTNGGRQVAVPSEYVQAYLEEGFEFVAVVGDKAIMRLLEG